MYVLFYQYKDNEPHMSIYNCMDDLEWKIIFQYEKWEEIPYKRHRDYEFDKKILEELSHKDGHVWYVKKIGMTLSRPSFSC